MEEVFCTKYALSAGVYKVTGLSGKEDFYPNKSHVLQVILGRGQWARTEAEALEQVNTMIVRRRKALLKEHEKLLRIENGVAQGDLPMVKEKS